MPSITPGATPPATANPMLAAAAPAQTASSGPAPRGIDPKLVAAARNGRVDAIVMFEQSQSPAIRSAVAALDVAESMPLGATRKQTAYRALQEIGNATIQENLPRLQQLQQSKGIEGFETLWSMNAALVRGADLNALAALAGKGVKHIFANDEIPLAQALNVSKVPASAPTGADQAAHGAVLLPTKSGDVEAPPTYPNYPEDPKAVYTDWGVRKMNAPAAWSQGITGAGIVIGSIDTGVITDHSGLKANFRGTQADGTVDYNYNYANFVEHNSAIPLDDVGHGTHTVGSVLGNDDRHLTGVAPDAKFIVARALGEKGGSMFGLMKAMEWMMAPTDLAGKNPRPELAPDIVTNSWGGAPASIPFLWMELRNWRRAGIIPVFASGNDRNARPGRVAAPGMYGETITVGASDNKDQRAWFSMYGPSNYSKTHKPEVIAPGVLTYSTVTDGSYSDTLIQDGKEYVWQGTSMATPHVTGAVALYMQAHPGAGFDEVMTALQRSGTLADKPNDEIGWGRVQVDKLITKDSISRDAKLTDPVRVAQLMDRFGRSKDWVDPPKSAAKRVDDRKH